MIGDRMDTDVKSGLEAGMHPAIAMCDTERTTM
jgi:ribonucleotide monophosphatase NagD (HAD superfamily)